jgi:hypothetical protein
MATTPKPSTEELLLGMKGSVASNLRGQGFASTRDALDKVFQNTAVGPLSTAIGDSFYGINHRQTPNPIQINKDFHGLAFFTRPRLNLTSENLRAVRQLGPLLNNEPASLQRIIRCLLDPEIAKGRGGTILSSPFVDPGQAFIPILTNHLISMSGWPDIIAPTFTSQEGVNKEAWSLVDGVTEPLQTFDITANFRNIPGDPITTMMLIWVHYQSMVYRGLLVPYPEMIIENEIDYQTRIYRLVLDASKTRVQKIAACGAAFPLNVPIGGAFDFDASRPINQAMSDQISINFRCMGAMYQDDILVKEFNDTVTLFNIMMDDRNREAGMVQIPMQALGVFNNRGYPHINPNTYKLEWWVSADDYSERMPLFSGQ